MRKRNRFFTALVALVMSATLAASAAQLKYNLVMSDTSDPTVNDDTGDGYVVGTVWVNTSSDDAWVLADVSAGAAVWLKLANIAVADLADGSVSAAEFQRLDGVTSDIQTQLDAKEGTVTEGSLTDSVVVSADIKDDVIVDADINASAAIDATKIADGSVTDTEFQYIGTLSSDAQTQLENLLSDGFADVDDGTELTVSSGAITATQTLHTVDGEGDAADDLVTISGGSEGSLLFLIPENSGRDITLVDDTGNIITSDDNDYTIPDDGWCLLLNDGSNWRVLAGGGTAAGSYVETSNATQYYARSFEINDEPDDDAQHFHIQIDDDADFSSTIVDHDSQDAGDGGDDQAGCEYFNGTAWVAWTSGSGVINSYEGNRGVYYFQSSSISRGTVYYIRMRWYDGTSWDDWSGDTQVW